MREMTVARPGRSAPANLRDQVGNAHLWPTPKARDYRSGCADRELRPNMPRDLNDSVLLWSTPAAQDAKNMTLPPSQMGRDTLPGDLLKAGVRGQLNPDWTEALQGYPPGWTRLPPDWRRSGGPRAAATRSSNGNRHASRKASPTGRRASE